jgi:hypothetical protein
MHLLNRDYFYLYFQRIGKEIAFQLAFLLKTMTMKLFMESAEKQLK